MGSPWWFVSVYVCVRPPKKKKERKLPVSKIERSRIESGVVCVLLMLCDLSSRKVVHKNWFSFFFVIFIYWVGYPSCLFACLVLPLPPPHSQKLEKNKTKKERQTNRSKKKKQIKQNKYNYILPNSSSSETFIFLFYFIFFIILELSSPPSAYFPPPPSLSLSPTKKLDICFVFPPKKNMK